MYCKASCLHIFSFFLFHSNSMITKMIYSKHCFSCFHINRLLCSNCMESQFSMNRRELKVPMVSIYIFFQDFPNTTPGYFLPGYKAVEGYFQRFSRKFPKDHRSLQYCFGYIKLQNAASDNHQTNKTNFSKSVDIH